jgi:glycosyltransferase involved in cell wall biosynthesis
VNRLLYAIYELKRKYADIKLSLIGDGPEIPEAKKIAKRLKLDKNVNFLGKISNRSKLFEEINKHEICLNISEKNKFRDSASPMKVFEYSALGKKIVSTNLHEVKRLNFSNILFYTEDGEGKNMIKTIQKAFDLEIDINKVRDAVKNYGWDKIIEKILGIIDYTILGEEHK